MTFKTQSTNAMPSVELTIQKLSEILFKPDCQA